MKIQGMSNINSNINRIRRFATIEDLIIKDKPVIAVSEKQEQKIINHMEEFYKQRVIEEYKAIESAKKIFLI